MNKSSNIKSRVLQLADKLGSGRRRFAEDIGMSYSSFTGSAKGTPLNSNAIANILAIHPEVNIEWLLTGKGEMLKSENDFYCHTGKKSPVVSDYTAFYNASFAAQTNQVPQWLTDERKNHDEIVLSQQRTIEKLTDILSKK